MSEAIELGVECSLHRSIGWFGAEMRGELLQEFVELADRHGDPPDPLVISITTDPASRSITIFDKGVGMDRKGVHDAKKIAVSPKGASGEFAGFRGIGIWAGFQACAKLELETKKAGEANRYRLEVDFADLLAKVNENISIKDLLDHISTALSDPQSVPRHDQDQRRVAMPVSAFTTGAD
jgi:hypothetical protein